MTTPNLIIFAAACVGLGALRTLLPLARDLASAAVRTDEEGHGRKPSDGSGAAGAQNGETGRSWTASPSCANARSMATNLRGVR